jgi:sialic acid synthase SpsE
MFWIFELANNHQGDVKHAFKIIDEFAKLKDEFDLNAAVKLQFRNLDTFIHKDYVDSDLKFVKRFRDTRLSLEQFKEIVEYIRSKGFATMATPFDNESIETHKQLNVDVLKIASCSIDDWPLLEEVSKVNKRIIISTAGASMETLRRVYNMFKAQESDFAFMHCVGEYPTPHTNANLKRISLLRREFKDIEVGFSTHESPTNTSLVNYASCLGASIVEKHVGMRTDKYELNQYSLTPDDMRKVLVDYYTFVESLNGTSPVEKASLNSLKRGAFAKRDIEAGTHLDPDDVYYAMPQIDIDQLNASNATEVFEGLAGITIKKDSPILRSDFVTQAIKSGLAEQYFTEVKKSLSKANLLNGIKRSDVELSAHYGIENFAETGATIINKINREYCKKLIVMLKGQKHPWHKHIIKEEAFELLHGDCTLVLRTDELQSTIELEKGVPHVILRGMDHSFFTKNGCIVEEVSTTHVKGDSVYADPTINKLSVSDRKVYLND